MLNLKKGLALVLAAATAFTFAPVSSFAASATWDDDGLTTTSQIDSIDFKEFTLDASSADSKEIHLAEHKDLSSTGKPVEGYRVTVTRGKGNEANKGRYFNLVDVSAPTKGKVTPTKNATPTPSAVTADNSWGGTSNAKATSDSYIVDNVAGYPADSNAEGNVYTVNGAYVEFAVNTTNIAKSDDASVTVTVTALTSYSADASSADDSSTFTINLNRHTESIEWGDVYLGTTKLAANSDGEYTIPEYDGTNENAVTVQYKVTNAKNGAAAGAVTWDTKGSATGLVDAATAEHPSSATADQTKWYNTVTLTATSTGKINFTVKVAKTTEANKTFDKTFTFNVVSANGKLRVTYQTKDGSTWTYTNNNEDRSGFGNGVIKAPATTNAVADGSITVGTERYVKSSNGVWSIDRTPLNITSKSGQQALTYGFDETGLLEEAHPVVAGDNATIQITASSDANADVSYALVAPDTLVDNTYKESQSSTPPYTYQSKTYNFNPVSGKFDGTLDKYDAALGTQSDNGDKEAVEVKSKKSNYFGIAGLDGAANGDTITFSEKAAKNYGAVDKTGLVTLKSAVVNVPLFVVVTAKEQKENADANLTARKTSTYIIPVEMNANQSLWFYAASQNSNAEIDEQEITGAPEYSDSNYDTLYLSDAQKSDTISYASNAGDSYITVSLKNNDGKFTYNPSTKTVSVTDAAKDGDSNDLVFKVTSAPNIEGTITAEVKVQYKKDWAKPATLSLSDVSVRKGSTTARKQITASAVTPANATVIFDHDYDYYVKDSSRPSGYRKLIASDAGFGDVLLTSNGYVSYDKNSGEVYVRAHAEASKTIPSKYAYSKVSYGAASLVTNNTLAIDKKSVVIKEGETATINATGNTVISATSSDTSVATVATAATANTGAAITVTGVKPGETTVKVTAAADAANGIDAAEIEVPVVVTDKNGNTVDDVTAPGKVTGLKVKNKKGAHVSVSWTNQGKNINYRVWKKVGNGKWVGKNVAGSKTTLSVKKGAKVQVKVKAYVKNTAGKTTWGPKATKAKTFKTDKK